MSIINPHNWFEEVLAIAIGLIVLLVLALVGLFVPKVRAYNKRMSAEASYHQDQ